MTIDLFPFMASVIAVLMMTTLCITVAKLPALQPGTLNPFGPHQVNPSSDTLQNESLTRTVMSDEKEWQLVTMHRLSDVEDFLDMLEAHKVRERQVHTLNNTSFAVRWR